MLQHLKDVLLAVNWTVLGYVIALDLSTLLLVVFGARRVLANRRWSGAEGHEQIFASPLTPAISVLVPAHDEEAGILGTLAAALAQRYPSFEIVLVDDGSTDRTFDLVAEAYGLTPVTPRWTADIPIEGEILSVHRATTGDPLTVLRKRSVGRRSDASNAALNLARHPLVCMLDADSLLEPEALLRIARPFVEDPDNVVGAGGVIRAVNGSVVDRGAVLEPRLSRRWLVRIQAVEYLRSFLLGRTGWADANALLIISGAFGLFRRDLLVEVGGMDPHSLAEDAELVVTLLEHQRRLGRPHRMVFVPEPVCWTEVPETWTVLGRQRRRWSQGLGQLLWKHRRMIGNPRFGTVGLLALPFFLLFEAIGPVVEVVGLASLTVAYLFGLLHLGGAASMLGVALLIGTLLSTTVVAVEEFTFHRYGGRRSLPALLAAGLLENVGFRQVHAWYRLQGLCRAITKRSAVWTAMPRTGFSAATVGEPALVGAARPGVGSLPVVTSGGQWQPGPHDGRPHGQAPHGQAPHGQPSYGQAPYGPPSGPPSGTGWAQPGVWPHGPGRPGSATAVAVLAIVTGSLTMLGGVYLGFLAGGSVLTTRLLSLGLPLGAVLLAGGISLLNRRWLGWVLKGAVAAAAVLVLALLAGAFTLPRDERLDLLLDVLVALPLPVVTAVLAAQTSVRQWAAAGD